MFTVVIVAFVWNAGFGIYLLIKHGRGQENLSDHRLPSGKGVLCEFYEPPSSGLTRMLEHLARDEDLLSGLKIHLDIPESYGDKVWHRTSSWDEIIGALRTADRENAHKFVARFFELLSEHGAWKCTPAFGPRLVEINRFSLNDMDRGSAWEMVEALDGQMGTETPLSEMGNSDLSRRLQREDMQPLFDGWQDPPCIVGVLCPEVQLGSQDSPWPQFRKGPVFIKG